MNNHKKSPNKPVVILFPFVLIPSTAIIFRYCSLILDSNYAILIGFLFYQIVWGIIFPMILIGVRGYMSLFTEESSIFKKKNILYILLLILTIVGSFIGFFLSNLKKYSILIFLLGIPMTTVNSFCEEVIWRGLFIKTFNKNILLSIVYPTICFGIWHISPELVNVNRSLIDMLPLIIITIPLGFVYSLVAYQNKSIKWVAITHTIIGILAFGEPLSTSLSQILGIPLK